MATQPTAMTTYSFEVDGELWDEWKDTVPRSQRLDERLTELIQADVEGRVSESNDDND